MLKDLADITLGVCSKIALLNFGGTSADFNVTGGTSFTVPFGTDSVQYFFTIPVDVTLVGISFTVNNFNSVSPNPGTDLRPFIAIATPTAGTYNFTINTSSRTYTSTGYPAGVITPSSKILSGINNSLNIPLAAGTIIGIVGGWSDLLGTESNSEYMYFAGSLLFK